MIHDFLTLHLSDTLLGHVGLKADLSQTNFISVFSLLTRAWVSAFEGLTEVSASQSVKMFRLFMLL